jgi:ATP-binding cassette subfamily F protein 3
MEFGGQALFNDISFLINKNDKIALIGRNGAGKTTLLKLLAGKLLHTKGNISKPKELSIGYLPQHLRVSNTTTVFEEAKTAFGNIIEIQTNINFLTKELSERKDHENKGYQQLIEEINYENERLRMLGSQNIDAETEKTLLGLGFLRTDFERNTSEFSGGWRMRIELAKILLQNSDLLLLDEPTNHLDIESISWLENFLSASSSAVMLVSHDKIFLDRVTKRSIEITLGKIYDYKVNYSKYLELRQEKHEQQIRAYENQQKMIADTKEFIERFRYKPTKAVQVQNRIRQLEKLQIIEVDLQDNSHLNLKFPPAPHSGVLPIDIENLTKNYNEHVILQNINMQIHRGEKVAFVGRNGEGKTTLIKCIMNEIEYAGRLQLGHNVKIGYFAQNQEAFLDNKKTVFQTIDDVATGDIRPKIRDILGAFMFDKQESEKCVEVLSGGERSRLAMICLLLEPVNLLILDEPTNHLDIQAKNILKEAIGKFNGTAVIVSHDRDFLDGLVTKIYEFKDKKAVEYLGGIEDFLQKKNFDSLSEIELRNPIKKDTVTNSVSENKLNYEEQRQQAKKIRRAQKQVEKAEEEIARLEEEIVKMEIYFANGTSSEENLAKYNKTKHLLEQKMYEWEVLHY